MNKIKRIAALLMCLAVLMLVFPVTFASAEEYTYTVTLYSGNMARFSDGSETMTVKGLREGDMVNFSSVLGSMSMDGDKYYVKGVRLSGRDNNTVASSAFRVTGDAMYVVAYGIRGEMVAYTVNYIDTEGNPLAESETYYGNVGDKPVVAFLYIEGYQPQAYNITQTLSENAADNHFDFIYTAVEGENPEGPGGGNEENPEDNPEENPEENPGGNPEGNGPVVIPENNVPAGGGDDNNGPVDIQDNDTPLAGGWFSSEDPQAVAVTKGVAIAAGGSGACLLPLLFFLNRKKRKDNEE